LNNKLQALQRQAKDFDEIVEEKENIIAQLQGEMDDQEGLMQEMQQKLKKTDLKLR
jgi:peptidoglycan hydrolase CwlO-like protein